MLARATDPRLWRLLDLSPDEQVVIRCQCQQNATCFGPGALQRQRRIASDTLIYDLQYRLRCRFCGRTRGFTIAVTRTRTDVSNLSEEQRITETLIVDDSG